MSAGPRVLFVNPGRALGGAEHSLILLLQGLRQRGIESTVTVFGEGTFRDRISGMGIHTVTLRLPRATRTAGRYRLPRGALAGAPLLAGALPAAIRLTGQVRRARVELIHTNGMKAHLLGGLAGRLARVPVVWHLRDFPPEGWVGRMFQEAAARLPQAILTPSRALAASVGGRNRGRPHVVPDPVDLGRFHPRISRDPIRRELRLTGMGPLIGLVGHLTPWKGHETFLAIARAVSDIVPAAHFVVAGGAIYETHGHAGYLESLRRRAGELGLSERLTFLGAIDDVPGILAELDLLVHCPTAPEPFGRVLAEAMAVGCPVVAARCGGIPEVIQDGLTGLLVVPGDVGAFVAAVLRVLREPALREMLGEVGRREAEMRFGIDQHAESVLGIYRSLLEGPRAAA